MHLLQTTAEAGRTKMELETAYEEVQSAKLDTEQLRVALEATEGKFNSMLSEARLEAEHVKKVIEKYKLEAEEIMTRSTKREGKSMASLREAEAKANASKEELEKSKMEVADLQGTAHQREIQVGMGPAGELRYTSYPESPGTWRFPGIGAFQCYDKFMISNLRATAEAAGKKDWGNGGPSDAGHYNNWPEDTPFFRRDGGWNCPYGEFFLKWYSGMLLDHGERILRAAEAIFRGTGTKLSGKVAGIHWHYGTRSHAPELTAGYYNTRFRDGYRPIASMFARNGVIFNFTCIEMKDWEQAGDAQCSPEKLLKQVISLQLGKLGSLLLGRMLFQGLIKMHTIRSLGMSVSDYQKMVKNTTVKPMCAFTYLRMNKHLFQRENWKLFVSFVRKMAQRGASSNSWEQEHIDTASFVHATGSLIQEVAALLHN